MLKPLANFHTTRVKSWTINFMGSENTFLKMVMSTKVNGKIISFPEKESTISLTKSITKDSFWIIKSTDRGSIITLTEQFTTANGNKAWNRVMENTLQWKKTSMKVKFTHIQVVTRRERNTASENASLQIKMSMKGIGKTIYLTERENTLILIPLKIQKSKYNATTEAGNKVSNMDRDFI